MIRLINAQNIFPIKDGSEDLTDTSTIFKSTILASAHQYKVDQQAYSW